MVSDSFIMNGYLWTIEFVNHNDSRLIDRTGKITVATTDPKDLKIYLSNELKGDFLITVFIHELSHCALWSFDLLYLIHKMTKPEYWIDMEEFICNFLADYGLTVFKIGYKKLGYNAWKNIPDEFKKIIA